MQTVHYIHTYVHTTRTYIPYVASHTYVHHIHDLTSTTYTTYTITVILTMRTIRAYIQNIHTYKQ